ncbi:MAG: carboxypeptidase-like regulatory domain-containing protein [Planctomycetaceae bacterium]|nr:carboxypeptidase-like regulatory domain-containing protein [Planctomycetaceae bacterium]
MKKLNILYVAIPLAVFFTVLFSGCGSSDNGSYSELQLANVKGTITFDGQPLANAQIQFEQNGSFSYGVTDANGNYQMHFDTKHTGVCPGQCIVRVWTTMKGPGFDELLQGNQGNTVSKEIIPVQYNHESKLTAAVEPMKSQSFDFDLKSGGKTQNAISLEGDSGGNE